MSAPVRSLFVTLRRSLANTREQHVRIVESLGLARRQQTVEKPNNAAIRGAINKVKHLLTVETDVARQARLAAEAAARAARPPIVVKHARL